MSVKLSLKMDHELEKSVHLAFKLALVLEILVVLEALGFAVGVHNPLLEGCKMN
jgi:hypothetical protein